MIAEKELRIGNYYQDDLHGEGKLIKWISSKKIELKLEYSRLLISYQDLSPIPLTEEWLLKFGFEKIGRNFTTKDNFIVWFSLNTETYNFRNSFSNDLEIKSVHQLQNLYWYLCQKELNK